jgi:hypothetical protein
VKIEGVFHNLMSIRSTMIQGHLSQVDISLKETKPLVEPNQVVIDTIYRFLLNFSEEISIRYFLMVTES